MNNTTSSPIQSVLLQPIPSWSLVRQISPIFRNIKPTDVIGRLNEEGQPIYTIKPSLGTALWASLHNLANAIVDAGTKTLQEAAMQNPFGPKYMDVPDFQFEVLGMKRPSIMDTVQRDLLDVYHPLSGWTTFEDVISSYKKLQKVGMEALCWIMDAKYKVIEQKVTDKWVWDEEDLGGNQGLQQPHNPTNALILHPTLSNQSGGPLGHNSLMLHPSLSKNSGGPLGNNALILHPNRSNQSGGPLVQNAMILHPKLSNTAKRRLRRAAKRGSKKVYPMEI
ncbi:hypothetical protein BKA70DRAFT_1453598 [Coprinopsis sp. MPI-PUGE-AT-0042]|nr:hypothetical protein BKA70DRAFT_1453598 [Coprinopsis sp. MPI-PUGE-AT-0042]